jgi:hypothetical protein
MSATLENVRKNVLFVGESGRWKHYQLSTITMTRIKQVPECNLTKEAIESIERMVYKSGDDIAVSIARSFERLEERTDAMESRLYSRFADLEDKMTATDELIEESARSLHAAGSPV